MVLSRQARVAAGRGERKAGEGLESEVHRSLFGVCSSLPGWRVP